jgi:mannobiose 2-epimerase
VQAEALVGAVTMFALTGDSRYAEVFERTWGFVDKVQTDWTSGEWHEAIEPDGSPRGGNKAHPWKAGYHNGRALIEAVERIRQLGAR